jgi:hypothetical protein
MISALPVSCGLFSLLQHAFTTASGNRVCTAQAICDFLADFHLLANSGGSQLTRLWELVPSSPTALGASDASATGMGGFWFPTLGFPPLLR